MASASVDEYLSTSYEHDRVVDARLVEKGESTAFHQLLNAILLRWFRQHEKAFHIKSLAEVRTRIIERARYRIPDVLVCTTPAPFTRVLTIVPDVVIEIVLPDDTQDESLARFRDYSRIGVRHLIQMHPEQHIAWRYENDSLIVTEFQSLVLPGRENLPFDTSSIFKQLRTELSEFEGR